MQDILFNTEQYIFSYRVAAIIIHKEQILLQKPVNEMGFSFPGGHVALGETNERTLTRELKEEVNLDISVKGLQWVAEIFFPWGKKPCHQLCLFYNVEIKNANGIPMKGIFKANDAIDNQKIDLEFHWIPISEIEMITLYPDQCKKLLQNSASEISHFVFKE